MVTHPSILAWRIPLTDIASRATVHGVTESWTWLKWLRIHMQSKKKRHKQGIWMDVVLPEFTARMNTQSNATPGRRLKGFWRWSKKKLWQEGWHTTGLIRLRPDMVPQEEKLSQSRISQYKTKWHRGHLQKGRRERNLLVEKVKEEGYMSCWHCSAAWRSICGWGAIAAYGLIPTRLCLISSRWMLGGAVNI